MAIDINEILKAAEIRTMKKDIKNMKELRTAKKTTKVNTLVKKAQAGQLVGEKKPLLQPSRATKKEPPKAEAIKKTELKANIVLEKEKTDQNPALQEENNKEKLYFKGVPLAVKEKLRATAKAEEVQRKKFMEDVEQWANSTEEK